MAPSWMVLIALLVGGGGSDLLDYVPTDSYWEGKNVTVSLDAMLAELKPAQRAQPNPADAESKPKAASVRRLMAIRTLGELKQKEALPDLAALLTSQEMFEAEYAQDAIDRIKGNPPHRAGPADLASDIWLLPADSRAVAQLTSRRGGSVSLEHELAALPLPQGQKPAQITHDMVNTLLEEAEQFGNVRLNAMTVGLSGDVSDKTGFAAVIARGKFDAEAIAALARREKVPSRHVADMEIFGPNGNDAFFLPSNDRLVFLTGPHSELFPVEELVTSVRNGKSKLGEVAELRQLIESTDTKQFLWAAAVMTPTYKQIRLLDPFHSVSLVAHAEQESLHFTLTGHGSDADRTKAAIDDLRQITDKALVDLQQEQQRMPALKALIDLLHAADFKSVGSDAAITAKLEANPSTVLLLPLLLSMPATQPVDPHAAPGTAPGL